MSNSSDYITPPELARRWGVDVQKVYEWIASGELRAINIAKDANGERPRYRISPDAIIEFEERRSTGQPAPPRRRRRRTRVEGPF